MLNKLSTPARKLLNTTFIVTLAILAIGVILCFVMPSMTAADILPVSLGIVIIQIVNVIKLLLLEYQVLKLCDMEDSNKAKLFAVGQGFLRFFLTAGGLIAAHFLPFDNHYALYAAIAAAFGWNIAVYALRFIKLDDDEDA